MVLAVLNQNKTKNPCCLNQTNFRSESFSGWRVLTLWLYYSSDSQKEQVLVFCEGQLKVGGQREETGRQRKRPHQALLVPGNHFLPATFFQAEPIEQEDGELTGLEVTANAANTYCKLCWLKCLGALMDFAVWHITVTNCQYMELQDVIWMFFIW